MAQHGHAGLRTERRGDTVEVVATGDLDMAAAFRFETEIDALLTSGDVKSVVLDLGHVTFVDSAGLGALLSLREQASRRGVELKVSNMSTAVRRILEVTGIGDLSSG